MIEVAERAVLCALFRRYPGTLVWIGGSVLHLLYASPRASYDVDLCPKGEAPPTAQLTAVVQSALDELNIISGTRYALEEVAGSAVPCLLVKDGGSPAFRIDFTRIAGAVADTKTTIIESPLGPQAVLVPTDSCLLLLKLEALLFRRFVKPADVFDIWFLLSRGTRLEKRHRAWLSVEVQARELDWTELESRLNKLTAERFLADLKKRLSDQAFHGWNRQRAQTAVDAVRRLARKGIRWP